VSIGKTVRQLLEARQMVILPGFGNLEIKETGKGTPAGGKKINPPGLYVKFDSSYSKDDSMLASAWAESGNLDAEEARQQVLELVDAIRFALDKGEQYELEGAGTFSRDDDGKVHFNPEKGWILEPDQYGLESMDLLELEDIPEETVEETAPVETGAESVPVPPTAPVTPRTAAASGEKTAAVSGSRGAPAAPVYGPWKKEKTHRKTSLWKIIWGIAAVLIIALLVLIFLPTERLNIFGDREETLEQAGPGGEAVEPGTVETPTKEEPAVPTAVEQALPEKVEPPPAQDAINKYFLIAGSFKHLANASELQDRLNSRGYHAEMLVTENRMYRVSAASYATREEAERGLSRIKQVPGLESCWLLCNE
jgi:nucleoid DNA-binding protein/cell division septation protein DedD